MMYVLGVLVLALGVGVSIALHELGHMITAKKFGVRCPQYMIGFGPTVWSRTRGETTYGVRAVPLGGFVRMIGMYPPKPVVARSDSRPVERPSAGGAVAVDEGTSGGRWSAMIEDARARSLEEIGDGDRDRVFYRLSAPRKLVVLLCGPLANLGVAALLIAGIVTIYGQAVPTDGTVVTSVVQCVRPLSSDAATDTKTPCSATDAPSPAAAAGLAPGDEIVAIDGVPVARTADIASAIRPKAEQAVRLDIVRDGVSQTLTLTPIEGTLPVYDDQGNPQTGPGGAVLTERAGYVGMTNAQNSALERQPITAVPGVVARGVSDTAGVMLRLPQKMVDVWNAAFGTSERDLNGPISVVGVGRIAGEAADGQIAFLKTPGQTVVFLVGLLASLNLALFVFNLLPLLPLDGGHAAGAIWEGARRQVARLRRRPDPGYVDVAKGLPVTYAMTMLLIGMFVLLIYADIVKPVKF